MPRWDELLDMYDGLHRLALDGKILSAHTVGQGGIAAAHHGGILTGIKSAITYCAGGETGTHQILLTG